MERDLTPSGEENSNSLVANTRCSFCLPCCFGSCRSTSVELASWDRVRSETQPITGDRWWSRGFMRVREWSVIVAGPRWKTFIRRFNRNRTGCFQHAGKYQYDPLSYAMNFDEGGVFEDDDAHDGFRDFYVAALPFKPVSTDSGQDVVVSR